MTEVSDQDIRNAVRDAYSKVAQDDKEAIAAVTSCCGTSGCCAPAERLADSVSVGLGYSEEDVTVVPEGANMGLGCGNPQAIAALREGESVLDLGSGGGFDVFLAARQIGSKGQAIGVDFTPDMVNKARQNTGKTGLSNVDFRLGEIEHLPVADNSVNVILSNCVINLSPDKAQVYREAFRVLQPGGRLAISDIVAFKALPEDAQEDLAMLTGCISGASTISENEQWLKEAGFIDIEISIKREESQALAKGWATQINLEDYVASASIEARKP